MLGALPTSNLIDCIQLLRDIHEMSSNGAHPLHGALIYIILIPHHIVLYGMLVLKLL